jgi:serine/threonine-protein kinase
MGLRERLEWFGRLAIMIFVLASVAFLSAITAIRFAIQGRQVGMPNLIGKKADEAQAMLQKLDLGMKVDDRVYSNNPVDTVVRQSPPPGIHVKIGQRAHLVLSLGGQKVTIPALGQKSLRAAQIELLRGGMQIGEQADVYLPGFPEDTVVLQNPAPGTSDATSPHVDLLVSLGSRPPAYVMPDLTGLTLVEAQQRLAAGGLKLGKISVQETPGALPGTVNAQTPAQGSRVEPGATVDLQVAG